ncbi:SMI1/KNR4 family protein [Bacillus sp. WLY-B-L8]|uniref:SMI1/KNR4 family protein n=1 Tax=Bacillus multifaciens TaxID=3068506 RepID=UPI0027423388|nr:SMI1/KNR4 family protein [Bacillus sp. WLY-B-L8]MDP7978518.1 SMI1/KNR4 family protein [Bacillus sp. WLY-B-L8]
MKWINFIESFTVDCKFYPPAREEAIVRMEEMFQVQFPNELKDFLRETDGVTYTAYDLSLVWSAKLIQRENLYMRRQEGVQEFHMPFASMLFVADAGNGDLFGYCVQNGVIKNDDIYVWNHEDNSTTWVAHSLQSFIDGWYNGRISI